MIDIDNELDLLLRAVITTSQLKNSDVDHIVITSITKIKDVFDPETKVKLHCRDCIHGVLWIGDYPCSQCKAYSFFTKGRLNLL